jgi:hypothetical protein
MTALLGSLHFLRVPQRLCTLHGGHLVTLEDPTDVSDLVRLIQANIGIGQLAPGSNLWIGLYSSQTPEYR